MFDGVETPLGCLKDNFIKTIYFWDNEKICSSSFDVAECMDTFVFRMYTVFCRMLAVNPCF